MEKIIDLPPLPVGWDALTADQMVQLNFIRHEHGQSRENYLFHAFCYLTGIEIVSSFKDEEGKTLYIFRLRENIRQKLTMAAWEIQFFISEKLKWLTEECTRLMDVFPTLILRGKTFGSPGYAMAGMTYMQYKKAQDYLVLYHRLTNQLIAMLDSKDVNEESAQRLIDERKRAKGSFLAAVYTPETLVHSRMVDGQNVACNPPEKAYVFSTGQISMYSSWFEELPDEKGDCIIQLFSGTMLNYRKMFPLLFPDKEDNRGKTMNFIEVESSTMNALQSKLNFNNYQTIYDSNAPFILEKLHAIIKEGKALDEQNRKMKAKRK